jgi:hypothetical protein
VSEFWIIKNLTRTDSVAELQIGLLIAARGMSEVPDGVLDFKSNSI